MRNDERGIDIARMNALQQGPHVAMGVRLTAANRQRLVDDGAERNLVQEAAVHAGHRQRSAVATGKDRFAQYARTIGLHLQGGLHTVVGALHARRMRLHPDCVDAGIRASTAGHFLQRLEHAQLFIVERFSTALARHAQSLGKAIDRDHTPRAEHECASDGELPHRTASPDCHRVALSNVAVLRGHVARRQDVREEQHLLV